MPVARVMSQDFSLSASTLDRFNISYYNEPAVLSIEEIKMQLYSCFTCGVSWLQDHVCLDCSECGGYSLQRPCPRCDGSCASSWKRDLTMSHACGKARWTGECQLESQDSVNPSKSATKEEEARVCSELKNLLRRS